MAGSQDAGRGALIRALLLMSAGGDGEPAVVLTSSPTLWRNDAAHGRVRVINLYELLASLGVRGQWAPSLDESVETELVMRGWPPERLRREYRPDPKSRALLDLVGMDDADRPLLAVEIKHDWEPVPPPAQLSGLAAESGVPWLLTATETSFLLWNTASGEHRLLDRAPSPGELGAQVGTGEESQFWTSPATPAGLTEAFASGPFRKVIIDSSFPYGLPRDMPALRTLADHVVALDPRVPSLRAASLDLWELLLVWVSCDHRCERVNAAGLPRLAFAAGKRELREYLLQRFGLLAVLACPGGMLDSGSSVRRSVYYFGGGRDAALFEELATGTDSDALAAAPPVSRLRTHLNDPGNTQDLTGPLSGAPNWPVDSPSVLVAALHKRLARLGPMVSIGEIASVSMSPAGARERRDAMSADADGPLRVEASNVGSGWVDQADLKRVPKAPLTPDDYLATGDVLLGRTLSPAGAKAAAFTVDVPAVAGTSLLRIRPHPGTIPAHYLAAFLSSAAGLVALRATCDATRPLTVAQLTAVQVPLLDAETMDLFEDVTTSEARLLALASTIRRRRGEAFEAEDAATLREGLDALRSEGLVVGEGAAAAGVLSYRISNFYPFPIAYGYRGLASISRPDKRYDAQVKFSEQLTAFIGSLALSLLAEEDLRALWPELNQQLVGNLSMGQWCGVARLCCRALASYEDHSLAASLAALFPRRRTRSSFAARLDLLVERRNAWIHEHDDRPVGQAELETGTEELRDQLDECMRILGFLVEHPIRLVEDYDWRDGVFDVTSLSFRGDHPAHPVDTSYLREPLTKKHLYIDTGPRGWHDLHPYLAVLDCTRCGARETYFVDGLNSRGGFAKLKSFERGHPERSEEFMQAMARWASPTPA